MYEIMKKTMLSSNIVLMDIKAPRTAKHCYPGQFVIVKMDEKGERVPLTICDYNREDGTVTIVFQTIGASTKMMAEYEVGDSFRDFVGPLGLATHLDGYKKVAVIGGGLGTAIAYPQAKAKCRPSWQNNRDLLPFPHSFRVRDGNAPRTRIPPRSEPKPWP